MPRPVPSDPAALRLSDAIAIARVICILGVVYVHAWTGRSGADLATMDNWQEELRWVLMESVGRSAVPLLGMISGWLVAGSARTRQWLPHVRSKARTILLPMVLWNLIAILLVSGSAWLWTLPAPVPPSLWWVVDEALIITRNPDINVQMPFLRDLFLCMVAAPLLVRLSGRWLALVAIMAALWSVAGWWQPLLMRPAILLFFVLGMAARRAGTAQRAVALPLWSAVAPFPILLVLKLALVLSGAAPSAAMMNALDILVRLAAALAFWRCAWALAGRSIAPSIKRIEPYAFFLFCAHLTFIWLLGPLIGRMTGPLGSPAYPVFLLLQPVLALGACMALGKLIAAFAPGAARLLSGGRLARRD